MIQNLPRELLWTDKTNISEFMCNELGNEIVSANSFANSSKTIVLGDETMLKLYNEAFYLSTRVVYEHGYNVQVETYMEEIMADLGDKELANYVICLMFNVLLLQSDKSKEVLYLVEKIQKNYISNMPSKILSWVNKIFKPRNGNAKYSLRPCPHSAGKLKDIDWNKITQGFSKQIIIDVLDLWGDNKEKGKVIRLIEQAYALRMPTLKREELVDRVDEEFFIQQKNIYKITNNVIEISASTNVPHATFLINNYFRYNNEYVKDTVKKVVEEFYLGKSVNLALIEIVLFDHGQLTRRDNHKLLVKILKEWGALGMERDEELVANGMSQKIRKLPEGPYQEWNDEYQKDRKYCIKIGKKLPQSMPYGRSK